MHLNLLVSAATYKHASQRKRRYNKNLKWLGCQNRLGSLNNSEKAFRCNMSYYDAEATCEFQADMVLFPSLLDAPVFL